MANILSEVTQDGMAALAMLAGCPMMNLGVLVVTRVVKVDLSMGSTGTDIVLCAEAHDLGAGTWVVDMTLAAGVLHVVSLCKGFPRF